MHEDDDTQRQNASLTPFFAKSSANFVPYFVVILRGRAQRSFAQCDRVGGEGSRESWNTAPHRRSPGAALATIAIEEIVLTILWRIEEGWQPGQEKADKGKQETDAERLGHR